MVIKKVINIESVCPDGHTIVQVLRVVIVVNVACRYFLHLSETTGSGEVIVAGSDEYWLVGSDETN